MNGRNEVEAHSIASPGSALFVSLVFLHFHSSLVHSLSCRRSILDTKKLGAVVVPRAMYSRLYCIPCYLSFYIHIHIYPIT